MAVPDQFNAELAARRAAYIAFPQAVPKKAVLQREGTSPCIGACPAGIKAHGYVSLVRSGKYEEAFQLVLDATPLVGHARPRLLRPLRGGVHPRQARGAGPDPADQALRRRQALREQQGSGIEAEAPNGTSVAVVGSGPAGLTAAWQLARKGYTVKIFEKRSQPGGFLRHAIPTYRLPHEVVDADIANLTALGVEIECDSKVTDLAELKAQGYEAVVIATGTQLATSMEVPVRMPRAWSPGLDFLNDVSNDRAPDLTGKRVVIVGGGNVAMDAARVSRRLGATEARVVYRRGREEMPAHHVEAKDADAEGTVFEFLVNPTAVVSEGGKVTGRHAAEDAPRRARRVRPPSSRARTEQRVHGRRRHGHHDHRHGS